MKRSLHNKWIAALREPGRKQGREYLNVDGAQCCLDVLCEVAGVRLSNGCRVYAQGDFSEQVLPFGLADELGMEPGGEPIKTPFGLSLTYLNDREGWTFAQIADELEANEGKYYLIEED